MLRRSQDAVHRSRAADVATQAGDLKTPKLGKDSFMSTVLEPRRRIDEALCAVNVEAHAAGVSKRSVDDLMAAQGAESGISRLRVSRVRAGLDETVEASETGVWTMFGFPCVYLDATYLNVRNSLCQPDRSEHPASADTRNRRPQLVIFGSCSWRKCLPSSRMSDVSRRSEQSNAAVLMLAAVLGYSLLPLLVDLSGEWGSVALVTGAWTLTHSLINATAVHRWGRQDGARVNAVDLLRRIPWWAYAAAFVAAFQWVFFAWSSRLTETAVTTVIFEFWPILFLVGRRVFPASRGKQPVTAGDVTLVVIAAIGLSLVIFSEGATSESSASIAGVALAALALVIAAGERIIHLLSGEIVADDLRQTRGSGGGPGEDARAKTRIGALQNVVARGAASVMLLTIGAVQVVGGTGDVPFVALAAGVGLGVVHAVSGLTFTYANHLSKTDTINSLYFAVPALALMWLWALTEVTVMNPSLFVSGGVGVLAVNMVIHLDPEGTGRQAGSTDSQIRGHGFRALVLALWGAGAFVVLRDDWLPEGMLRWGAGEYWGMLTLLTTVFVFILSFRQSRVAEREREADRLVLESLAEIEMLRDDGIMSPDTADELIGHLNEIDRGRDTGGIGNGYLNFRRVLLTPRDAESSQGRRRLLLNVEILTSLRQHGREVTELAVMALFAGLVGAVALLFRPSRPDGPLSGWEGFGTELVVMCMSAAVAFLEFDLLDRRRLRDNPRLRHVLDDATREQRQPSGWRLNLHSDSAHSATNASRALSLALGAAVIATFALLLGDKWL